MGEQGTAERGGGVLLKWGWELQQVPDEQLAATQNAKMRD